MHDSEVDLHEHLLKELLDAMPHSSPQVREVAGVTLSVLWSNIQLYRSFPHSRERENKNRMENLANHLAKRASELVICIQSSNRCDRSEESDSNVHQNVCTADSQGDIKWMKTLVHFIVSSLKSGRSSHLLDVLAGFLHLVLYLQETSNKDLSTLAKAAFELLKWRIFWKPHLQRVVETILTSVDDPNWRTRSATLTYLGTFMYRHTFILSIPEEKQQIMDAVGRLLVDNQVEVREHAAAVLAGLMKGGDEDLASAFRDRGLAEATIIWKKSKKNSKLALPITTIHGAVLALAASVLSVPYDMPRISVPCALRLTVLAYWCYIWLPEHVNLLSRFSGEPSPVKSTVMKAIAESRHIHADIWSLHKESFTEEQLELLADTSSSSSYFA